MKTKEQIVEKLRDSFMALQKEYRVSERWVEHFQELFYELAQLLTTPAPPQSGVVDIYEERAHHSHTATSLDTAPPQSAEEWKEFVKHTSNHIGNNTALKWYSQWHMKERPIYQKQLISGYVQESIYAYFHNINNKTPKPRNEPPPKLGAEEWIRNSVYGQELDEDEIKALVAIINEYNQYAK